MGNHQTLIHLRSGDVFTPFFQKIGPGITTALIATLGIYFLDLARKTGLLWNKLQQPCGISNLMECRDGYLLNISWSLTMVILFPAVFFVVTRFYKEVPGAILSVGNHELLDKVINSINQKWIMGLYVLLPVLWYFYFESIVDDATWTWNFVPPSCEGKKNCIFIFEAWKSISLLGVLTTLFHVLNGLFIVCLVRAVLIGKLVVQEIRENPSRLSFAHSDGLYGLSRIANLLRYIYLIIALLTVYIISYVTDKILIQGVFLNALTISTIYSGAWFFFFFIVRKQFTEPLQHAMIAEKETELRRLHKEIEKRSGLHQSYQDLWDTKERIQTLPEDIVVFKLWKTVGFAPILTAVVTAIITKLIDKIS